MSEERGHRKQCARLAAAVILSASSILLVTGCSSKQGITSQSPSETDENLAEAHRLEHTPETHQVIYAAELTFAPERLDIRTGDTVIFANDSDTFVWPASNIHPTHDILPSFDARKPIKPGETWTHQFTKNGYWRYHNHIQPTETGLIVATSPVADKAEPLHLTATASDFPAPSESAGADYDLHNNKDHLRNHLQLYGLEATLIALEQTGPLTDCYDRAKIAGRIVFEELNQAVFDLTLPQCHSGAYHGAFEAIFTAKGTNNFAAAATTACSTTTNSLAIHQCMHNVGRGAMAGTTYELHDSLQLCDTLSTPVDQTSCHTGVFTENITNGSIGLMGHTTQYIKYNDPHYPCDTLQDTHMSSCYFYQTSHMQKIFNYNYSKSVEACSETPQQAQPYCYASLGRDIGNDTSGNPDATITRCSLITDDFHHITCTQAALQAQFSQPDEADDAITLCDMLDHDSENQNVCYGTIITSAYDIITDPTQLNLFCAKLPQPHQQACQTHTPE